MSQKIQLKLPTSPAGIVVTVTLSAVLALAAWTGYTYFFAPPPTIPPETSTEQYYNAELKKIAQELAKYQAYQIQISGDVDTGKPDPFQDF